MKWRSLRLRLLVGGLAAIGVALAMAGIGLSVLFERHVTRTIAEELDVHMKQLLAGIDVDATNAITIARPPVDPRFANPLSGLYWQVSEDQRQLLRSRSLWDATLDLPADELAPGKVHLHAAKGPAGARVLMMERKVVLTVGDQHASVRLVVAKDLASVARASSAFAKDLTFALILLSVALTMATAMQVALGLRPLAALRRGVAKVRSGDEHRLSSTGPTEVQPLVDELNALLSAQDREIERARSRAGDLAHGLKTPLVALAADVERLRQQGLKDIASDIEQIGDAMSRQIDRELARTRARGATSGNRAPSTDLATLAQSLMSTLMRTPTGNRITFQMRIEEALRVPIDRTDLAEILGNLFDNAARHTRSIIRVSASGSGNGASITIDDDGPGIAPEVRVAMLKRGVQLDERGGAAGLGLAIVQDVLDAYGWRLDLATSDLGGLKATIALAGATPPSGSHRGANVGERGI